MKYSGAFRCCWWTRNLQVEQVTLRGWYRGSKQAYYLEYWCEAWTGDFRVVWVFNKYFRDCGILLRFTVVFLQQWKYWTGTSLLGHSFFPKFHIILPIFRVS
jgi:hypothetical protein